MSRIEHDSFGEIHVANDAYWGAQTERSRHHFKFEHEAMPFELTQALIETKRCMIQAAGNLGLMKTEWVDVIRLACNEAINWPHQFPLVIWQTGSGTQTNMNVNEVIAKRANELLGFARDQEGPIHPNDHVNFGQSSNDVFPTAMHVAILHQLHDLLLPKLRLFIEALSAKAESWHHIVTIARTHMQDATPIRLGQEFSGYASQIKLALERIMDTTNRLYRLPQGGTAVGTGLNCPNGLIDRFLNILSDQTGWPVRAADNYFEALSNHDHFVELSGQYNVLACALMKIANDIRLLGSGPRCGLGELILPENEPGSSIMPGKINPTQCESLTMVCAQVTGNHTAITIAGSNGHFQLNVFKPLIISNILRSGKLLASAMQNFRIYCLEGLKPNESQIKEYRENGLMLVTALAPHIGYEKAAQIAHKALHENISLHEAARNLGESEAFEKWGKPEDMC